MTLATVRPARLCLLWATVTASAPVLACTAVNAMQHELWGDRGIAQESTADVLLDGPLSAPTVSRFTGCSPGARIPVLIRPSMPGLTYIRDVFWSGQWYPAYAFSASSPLIAFRVLRLPSAGGNQPVPLRIDQSTETTIETGFGRVAEPMLGVVLFSRGGVMTEVPAFGGSVEFSLRDNPAVMLRYTVELKIRLPHLPCTASDAALVLDPAQAVDLSTPGATTGTRPLEVVVNCRSAGTPLNLTVADIHGDSGEPGQLVPTTDSVARGVSLRLLRAGAPVRFSSRWRHGLSAAGQQRIPFEVQYIRTDAALVPGRLQGEATLTLDHR